MKKILLFLLLIITNLIYSQGIDYVIVDSQGKVLKQVGTGNIYVEKKDANNYEYTPVIDWIKVNDVTDNEIWILANDEGDRYSSFYCTVSASGTYNMQIYGGASGTTLLSTYGATASGTQMNFQIPLSQGKPSYLGYSTYKIRIYATNSSNYILSFGVAQHPSTTVTENRWLIMNFGTKHIKNIESNSFLYAGTIVSKIVSLKYVNTWYCREINGNYYFANITSLEKVTMPYTMNYATYIGLFRTYPFYTYGAFSGCTSLKELIMPVEMNQLTLLSGFPHDQNVNYPTGLASGCTALTYVKMPDKLNSLLYFGSTNSFGYPIGAFQGCTALQRIDMPTEMNSLISFGSSKVGILCYGAFQGCTALQTLTIPDSLPSLLHTGGDYGGFVSGCTNLTNVYGMKYMPSLLNAKSVYNNCFALNNLPTCSTYGSNSIPFSSVVRNMTNFNQPTLRCSSLLLTGTSASVRSQLTYINIDWANSIFSGTNPQIDLRYNALSNTEIDRIFGLLPNYSGSGVTHTINVASNVGSATCTPSIATLKGWTVIIL